MIDSYVISTKFLCEITQSFHFFKCMYIHMQLWKCIIICLSPFGCFLAQLIFFNVCQIVKKDQNNEMMTKKDLRRYSNQIKMFVLISYESHFNHSGPNFEVPACRCCETGNSYFGRRSNYRIPTCRLPTYRLSTYQLSTNWPSIFRLTSSGL
jgi:hypothetical protein